MYRRTRNWIALLGVFVFAWSAATAASAQTRLFNVSYDRTRELYREFNAAFMAYWKQETGATVTIRNRSVAPVRRRAP